MFRRMIGPLALLLALCPLAAQAQDWPLRQPVKVIVPFTAGSSTDIAARTIADMPFLVGTNTKYESLKQLIETAKKPGGTILYGTAGAGSSGHLFMELLRLTAGYPATHIPFRGTPEAMTEMISGRLDMYPTPAANAIPLTREGKIHSLAVSSPKRLPTLPEVATLRELGLPDAEYQFWVGAFAPAKTPKPIVEQLNRHIVAALNMKDVADKLQALGGSPMPMSIAEFEGFVRQQIALNAKIVKAAGYQPQ